MGPEKIATELGFKILEKIRYNLSGGVYIFSGVYKGEPAILKLVKITNNRKTLSIKKEIKSDNFLILISKKNNAILPITSVIAHGQSNRYIWLIRKYFQGESLANINDESSLLYGYDLIKPFFLNKREIFIKRALQSYKLISSYQPTENEVSLFKNRFERNLNLYDIDKFEAVFGPEISKSIDFYNSVAKDLFSINNLRISLGDFMPANIIISGEEKIIFIDFEWLSFDNKTADYAYLWLFLHRYPDCQKIVADALGSSDNAKKQFRASVIRAIIGWYSEMNVLNSSDLARRDGYKDHVWARYLKAAGESFEALTNIK